MTGADFAGLLDAARHDVDAGRVPACQLAVARNGEVVLFEALGDASTDTRFCVFSAIKPIVAAAVWLLIGDGALDVSLPVAEYVPEFATNGKEQVTVEQVLLHTAGFPLAPMAATEGADAARRRARFRDWYLQWEPGSRFEYHFESAHWVLVDLLERLTGEDFRDVIEARLCRPLGLPRLLGAPIDEQDGIAPLVVVGEDEADGSDAPDAALDAADRAAFTGDWTELLVLNDPLVREAGIPGGGGIMTASDLALFYQALMQNPDELWRPDVLADGTARVRCTFPDPMFGVPVNRTIGVVVAGDDGQHVLRYASFGERSSPSAFGHAGAHGQVGWADPATGTSFAYVQSGLSSDLVRAGARAFILSTQAARLFA